MLLRGSSGNSSSGSGRGGGGCRRLGLAVVHHVRLDKLVGGQRSHETQLPRQHGRAHDLRQLARVVSGTRARALCSPAHTADLQATRLRRQVRASAHSAHLHTGHGHAHVQRSHVLRVLHDGEAVAALHVLRGILPRGQKHCSDDVGGVRVEPAHATRHGGADVVLLLVGLDHVVHRALQHGLDNVLGDDRLHHDALAAAQDPVDRGGLLVCAHIARDGHQHQIGELGLQHLDGLEASLGDHVHAHSVARHAVEAQVDVASSHGGLHADQLAVVGGGVEGLLQLLVVLQCPAPALHGGGAHGRGQTQTRRAGDAVLHHHRHAPTRHRDGLAAAVGRGHQTALGGGHGDVDGLSVDHQGPHHAHGDGHVSDDDLAVSAKHLAVVIPGVRDQREVLLQHVLVQRAPHPDCALIVAQLLLQLVVFQGAVQQLRQNVFVGELSELHRVPSRGSRGGRCSGRFVRADDGVVAGCVLVVSRGSRESGPLLKHLCAGAGRGCLDEGRGLLLRRILFLLLLLFLFVGIVLQTVGAGRLG
mmetsp:Transcript_63730/g.132699  ORF Transcript_63730/g.132699 Transcript_63730/m.132699 type:complete len:531 (-) Transcript_63730:312-1904(-)